MADCYVDVLHYIAEKYRMRKYRDEEGFEDEVSEEERKEEARRELRLIKQFRVAVKAMYHISLLNLFHILNPTPISNAAVLDSATTVPPKKRRAVGKWHIMFFLSINVSQSIGFVYGLLTI